MSTPRTAVLRAGARRALALVAVVAALGVAGAQTPTRDNPFPRVDGARTLGPFLVDLGFAIDNIGYDDNVFLAPPDRPEDFEEAYVIRMGPEFTAQSQFGPRVALTIHDKLSAEVYIGVDDLDTADNSFDAQLDILLGSVLLSSRGEWTTTRQRPFDETDQRLRREDTRLKQTARWFVGSKTDLFAEGELVRSRYSDPDVDQRFFIFVDPDGDGTGELVEAGGITASVAYDRDVTELTGGIGWRPNGKTRFFAEYQFSEYDYIADELLRDSEDERVSVGMEFRPDARLSGRISVGRAKLQNTEASLVNPPDPFDGTVGRAQLRYRPTERVQATIEYEKDVRFSNYDQNFYYELDSRSLDLEWYLGPTFGLQGGYSLRELDWPELSLRDVDEDGNPLLRRDEIENWYAGFLFVFRSGLALGLRYGERTRESNLASAFDEQTYISTTGSFTF